MSTRNKRLLLLATALAVLTLFAGSGAVAFAAPPSPALPTTFHDVCGPVGPGYARCFAVAPTVSTQLQFSPNKSAGIYPLQPKTMKAAYGYSQSWAAGMGKTVAIVDAFDNPTAEKDLAVFSKQWGLPACTTKNGCFKKVNQTGGSAMPPTNGDWGVEIDLDIEWVHAIAPSAHILLVEAKSNSFDDLAVAENYAKNHALYVSNSWGAGEWSTEIYYDNLWYKPGVSIFFSSGDSGLPAQYPSASPKVISVGGTSLNLNSHGQFVSETAWSWNNYYRWAAGGGCSKYEPATTPQKVNPGYARLHCDGNRATPDISLDADPFTGVWVYDATPDSYGDMGWLAGVGGTSLSSPMLAARAAISGKVFTPTFIYTNNIPYRDITVGNNHAPCLVGFDLCTGLGSWPGLKP